MLAIFDVAALDTHAVTKVTDALRTADEGDTSAGKDISMPPVYKLASALSIQARESAGPRTTRPATDPMVVGSSRESVICVTRSRQPDETGAAPLSGRSAAT